MSSDRADTCLFVQENRERLMQPKQGLNPLFIRPVERGVREEIGWVTACFYPPYLSVHVADWAPFLVSGVDPSLDPALLLA
jgi:hypothetical protein